MLIDEKHPKTTEAAILVALKQPLVVDKIMLPSELAPGQVLVELFYSGICGSQIGEINGVKGYDNFLPHLLGHEGVGRVLQAGPGVRHVKDDDYVILHWRKSNGIEAVPPHYQWQGRKLNAGWVTSFNKHAVISENRLTPVAENINLQVASLFGCAITTGFGVIVNDANVKIGETVVIYGAGGVGLNMVQAAKLSGACPVIAVDLFDDKLKLARDLGATHVINGRTGNAFEEISTIVGQEGADVFIDNTGVPEIIENGYRMIADDGRLVLVGVPHHDKNITIHSLPIHFGKNIIGSHGGDARPQRDIPRYLKLYEQNYIELDHLISQSFKLDQINDAIAAVRDGTLPGRVVVDMETV